MVEKFSSRNAVNALHELANMGCGSVENLVQRAATPVSTAGRSSSTFAGSQRGSSGFKRGHPGRFAISAPAVALVSEAGACVGGGALNL